MGHRIPTIVIEPRSLIRKALVSLMESDSCCLVVGDFASTAGIDDRSLAEPAPLVVLGNLPADEAVNAAAIIRKRWPRTKIILLFDQMSHGDAQQLAASEFDGCIPLFASADALVGTIQQIIAADLRILMLKFETQSTARPRGWQDEANESGLVSKILVSGEDAENGAIDRTNSVRIAHGLSPREEEILKSVVRGHSYKMIAESCGVANSTVKADMRSILRKIRVANRTQAAIWAHEQGYGADVMNARRLDANLDAIPT